VLAELDRRQVIGMPAFIFFENVSEFRCVDHQSETEDTMEIKAIHFFTKEYQDAKSLFERAFPAYERFPLWLLTVMSFRKGFAYKAFYEEEQFCGLAYYGYSNETLYLC
jgi:hypothetical protein